VASIDSGALLVLNQILGIAGAGGGSLTDLDTGRLDQVINVNDIVRRSRSLVGTDGITLMIHENVHTDAENLTSTVEPYNPGTVLSIPPYPSTVPRGFDFWMLAAAVRVTGGTASGLADALLTIGYGARVVGLAVDDGGGAPASPSSSITLGFWDSATALGQGQRENGDVMLPLGIRLPRGASVAFFSASTVTVSVQLQTICALLPAALGQDVKT